MSDERKVRSIGVSEQVSPRRYTRAEVAAARRRGLANGSNDNPGGPIFWASGPYTLDLVRGKLADYRIIAAAMEREWDATEGEEAS
jgi:hypothetical protein